LKFILLSNSIRWKFESIQIESTLIWFFTELKSMWQNPNRIRTESIHCESYSRSLSFSRLSSFFRSRSTSEQERASSSVIESDVNDQELQRIVRNESSEKLINEYVKRRFQSYLNNNVENVDLWKSIYYDFEYFTLRIWQMISSDNWIFIKRICLTQEFWLNQADQKNSRSKIMYKVSKKNYYADWTLIQIERVEKAYDKLFRDMQFRKNKLQSLSIQSSSIQLSSSI
jgi:hypothetical protein